MMELNTRFKPDTYSFMRAVAACLTRSDTFGKKVLTRVCLHVPFYREDAEQLTRKTKKRKNLMPVELWKACPCNIFPSWTVSCCPYLHCPWRHASFSGETLGCQLDNRQCAAMGSNVYRWTALLVPDFFWMRINSLKYQEIVAVLSINPGRLLLYKAQSPMSNFELKFVCMSILTRYILWLFSCCLGLIAVSEWVLLFFCVDLVVLSLWMSKKQQHIFKHFPACRAG